MMKPWKLVVTVLALLFMQIGHMALAVDEGASDDRFLFLIAGIGFAIILAIKALAFETKNTWQARTMRREWWGE